MPKIVKGALMLCLLGAFTAAANAQNLNKVGLSLSQVLGGNRVLGSVNLTAVATAPITVNLQSSNSGVYPVPAQVIVPQGKAFQTFAANTAPVSAQTQITVTATLGTDQKSANLTVIPPVLTSISTTAPNVVGSNGILAHVYLNGLAPSGGVSVQVSSNNPVAQVPSPVTVNTGRSYATFQVTTTAVAAAVPVQLTAQTSDGATQNCVLNVIPPAPASISTTSPHIVGGNGILGHVYLNGLAPTGGLDVQLQSNNSIANLPTDVVVAPGHRYATFLVTTSAVSAETQVQLSASANSVTQNFILDVLPANLSSISTTSPGVIGSNGIQAHVYLDGLAPTGGISVDVSSDTPPLAQMPTPVAVAAGKSYTTFVVTTRAVFSATPVQLTAAYNGTIKSSTLTILPPVVVTLASNAPLGAAAYQDGNRKWSELPVSGNSLQFNVYTYNGKYSLAVRDNNGALYLYHATTMELPSITLNIHVPPVSSVVNGNVGGIPPGTTALTATTGHLSNNTSSSVTLSGPSAGSFTLSALTGIDDFAVISQNFNPGAPNDTVKLIRSVTVSDGINVDLSSLPAVLLTQASQPTSPLSAFNCIWITAGGTDVNLNSAFSSGTLYYQLPNVVQIAGGDRLIVSTQTGADISALTEVQGLNAATSISPSTPSGLTPGGTFSASPAAGTSYGRFIASFTAQTNANLYRLIYPAAGGLNTYIYITSGWLGSNSGTMQYTLPDLSGVSSIDLTTIAPVSGTFFLYSKYLPGMSVLPSWFNTGTGDQDYPVGADVVTTGSQTNFAAP